MKTVPYQEGSNLPILYTLSGGKIAKTYIAMQTHAFHLKNKAYFLKEGEESPNMHKSLIQEDNIIEDEATIPVVKPYILPLKPKKKRVKSKPTTKTDDINLSICGECKMQEPANEVRCLEDCKECKVSFENLSQPSRLLLHYHNKLDHMGFDAIRALARKGFMPKCLKRANAVKCAATKQIKHILNQHQRKES